MGSPRVLVAIVLLAVAGTAVATASAERALGERLYRTGTNARDEPVRALVGLPPKPISGEAAACIACHALDGRGAADLAPDVRWAALSARGGARYDERLFARAVNDGLDPSGAPVGPAMPRYSLSRSELNALVAFLKAPTAGKKN